MVPGETFWFVVALVVLAVSTFVLLRMFRRRLAQVTTARTEAHWADPESYRDHHHVRWAGGPPADLEPTPRHRVLAVAAPLGICSGDPWDRLAHRDRALVERELADAWDVGSRAGLLTSMHWLLTHGHRVGFEREVGTWSALPRQEADDFERSLVAGANASGDAEALRRFRAVRADERSVRTARFEAWDLVRCAMLARAGVTIGHLTEAEAEDALALVARELDETYDGWEGLVDSFHLGHWYWRAPAGVEEAQTDAHDVSRREALLDPADGPLAHVPWDVVAPADRGLLVDAMVTAGVAAPRPADELTTPAAQRLDAAVRRRTGGE